MFHFVQPSQKYNPPKVTPIPSGGEVYQSPLAPLIVVQRSLPKENPFSVAPTHDSCNKKRKDVCVKSGQYVDFDDQHRQIKC